MQMGLAVFDIKMARAGTLACADDQPFGVPEYMPSKLDAASNRETYICGEISPAKRLTRRGFPLPRRANSTGGLPFAGPPPGQGPRQPPDPPPRGPRLVR